MSLKGSRAAYPLVLPTWLVLGIFLLLPLVLMLVLSFAERDTYGGIKPIDDLGEHISSGDFLANYQRSLEPIYLGIYWRSVWMAVATTVLCLLIGYPMALGLTQQMSPPNMRARLISLFTMITFGLQTIAVLLLGFVAENFSIQTAIQLNALLLITGAVVMLVRRTEFRRWVFTPQTAPPTTPEPKVEALAGAD